MKILLDEMYTGLKPYLEALGWDVITTEEAGKKGAEDLNVVDYAKQNGLIFVTNDQKASEIAGIKGVKSVLVGSVEMARAIDRKLRNMQ